MFIRKNGADIIFNTEITTCPCVVNCLPEFHKKYHSLFLKTILLFYIFECDELIVCFIIK